MALSVLELKIIVLCSFLIMTFLFGMIPVIFIRYISRNVPISEVDEYQRNKLAKYKRVMSFLSCFAAGVFLATCFLDLLPDVQKNLIHIISKWTNFPGFPVAEFVMIIGLFLILVIEQIVLTVKERSLNNDSNYSQLPTEDQPILQNNQTNGYSTMQQDQEQRENALTVSYESQHSLGGICDEPHIAQTSPAFEQNLNSHNIDRKHASPGSGPQRRYPVQKQESKYSRQSSCDSHGHSHALRHDHHQHAPASNTDTNNRLQTHSRLRAMLLVCALSLHSVFEGITVGLLTDTANVLNVFAALTLHKSILSFSLGMSMVQSKISMMSAVKSIIGFSVSSPIGVIIGILVTNWTSTNSGIAHGVLQGIASGTFLYIIFFEILPKEFNCEVDRILKVLFLIIGFSVVTGIMFLGDEVKEPLCSGD